MQFCFVLFCGDIIIFNHLISFIMRKVFLMAALIGGVYGTANANGWCRTGIANIYDNDNG